MGEAVEFAKLPRFLAQWCLVAIQTCLVGKRYRVLRELGIDQREGSMG